MIQNYNWAVQHVIFQSFYIFIYYKHFLDLLISINETKPRRILAYVLRIKSCWFINSFSIQTLLVKRKLHFLIPKVTAFK